MWVLVIVGMGRWDVEVKECCDGRWNVEWARGLIGLSLGVDSSWDVRSHVWVIIVGM